MVILAIFLYYVLLARGASQAAPGPIALPNVINLVPSLITRLDPGTVDDVNHCNRRSVWNIVWSCLTTLFACTWVAMHPNIPGPRDGHWKILSRRLAMMRVVILLPEMILLREWVQYYAAREVAERFNTSPECMRAVSMLNFTTIHLVGVNMAEVARWQEPWTQTHGFFAVMGGFMLCRFDGEPLLTLTPEKLFQHIEEGAIECPRITKEEIWDRSRGDYLAKAIVIIQTSWFVTTCLARHIRQLPITELEIATLAFATLNGFIYIPWWNKPLDVRRPIHVYFKQGYDGPLVSVLGNINAQQLYVPPCDLNIKQYLCGILGAFARPPCVSTSSAVGQAAHNMRVPTLSSAGPSDSYEGRTVALMALISTVVLGSAFGGIHMAAWSFKFPTEAEKWVWRISSLCLVGGPVSIFITLVAKTWAEKVLNADGTSFTIVCTIIFVPYALARVILLILPFITLRSLPPGALTTVEWSLFFPHAA